MAKIMDGLRRPFTGFKKLLIGMVLSIFPIINFFSLGYLAECARTTKKSDLELPEWKEWGKFFSDGFFMIVIGIIYFIPLLLITIVAFGMNSVLILFKITDAQVHLTPLLIIMVLGIITSYFLAYAILSYINERKFKAAFRMEVFQNTLNKRYLVIWSKALLVAIVFMTIIQGILGLVNISLVNSILSSMLQFIMGISYYTVLGEAYDG